MGERIKLSGGERDATGKFGKRFLHFKAGTKRWCRSQINRRLRRRAKRELQFPHPEPTP